MFAISNYLHNPQHLLITYMRETMTKISKENEFIFIHFVVKSAKCSVKEKVIIKTNYNH